MAEGKGRPEFEHLYNYDAPWTGLSGGEEFVEYLRKVRAENRVKELPYPEKRCLEKLEQWEKSLGGEKPEQETMSFDDNSMPWKEIRKPSDIAFFLSAYYLPTRYNKAIASFIKRKLESGMSVLELAEHARVKYQEQLGKYINEKGQQIKEFGSEKDTLSKVVYLFKKSREKQFDENTPDIALWDKVKALAVVVSPENESKKTETKDGSVKGDVKTNESPNAEDKTQENGENNSEQAEQQRENV